MRPAARLPTFERARRRRRSLRGWIRRAKVECRYGWKLARERMLNATPVRQVRFALTALLLLSGAMLLAVLVVPQYDRALVLSGRTEVLSMTLDDAAFGTLDFPRAIFRADPDTGPREGALQLDITPGTTVRFVRSGRGDLRLNFAADPAAALDPSCGVGLRSIGAFSSGDTNAPLCEAAVAVVPLHPGEEPVVVGLSGGIVVGEEVSQGVGSRPLLLEATASLLVKHGNWFFRRLCAWDAVENLCDRFVANSVALSPGDSVRADDRRASQHSPAGLGFIRADPDDVTSGMLFNLAAPATAFQVQRMQGETFTVRESLFDVIEKSPVVRTLNIAVASLGLIWYFLRLTDRSSGETGRNTVAALLAAAILCAPDPAQAQQAYLRAEDTGQALLRSRGDRCYAVTPAHVLGSETSALATAPGRERGEGDLLRRIPAAPEAIALISLRGIPLSVCPAFEGAVSLDDLLRAHTDATLRLVRADGSIEQTPLLLGTIEIETLEVRSATGSLQQGMSGGTVLVSNQPVGLLFDVTDEGHTGRVGRLDRIFERLAPHLTTAVPAEPAHAPTGSVPYEIVRSNAAPVAPENKASSLQGDGPGPWRVLAEGRVDLVLKAGAAFRGMALDLSGIADPPQSVEVLGGRSELGPWQSLVSFTLEQGDKIQRRPFPPVSLAYVLVRSYPPPGQRTLAMSRLSLMPK